MVGLGGNDTYIVDDLGRRGVEAAARAPTRSQTLTGRALDRAMANVENLTYTGVDADPFVGTGNASTTSSPAATSPTR